MDLSAATVEAFQLLLSGDRNTWEIVAVSLRVSVMALCLALPLALAAAYGLALGRFPGRRFLFVLLQGFLSFPTVVIGLLLYMLLSRGGPLGAWNMLFTPAAMTIGQTLIAFPVLTVFTLSVLQRNGAVVRETARALGASRFRALLSECFEARFGLLAGLLAAFGRVVSEVGCALMVGGNIAHYTRTLPTAIALETGKGGFAEGIALGIVLIALAVAASALLSLAQGGGDE